MNMNLTEAACVRQNALEIWCKMHNYIALLLTEHDLQVDVLLTKLV